MPNAVSESESESERIILKQKESIQDGRSCITFFVFWSKKTRLLGKKKETNDV